MPPGYIPGGGVLGMSIWEEILGQTQDMLEGLYLLVAWKHLGIPQDESLPSLLPPHPGPK